MSSLESFTLDSENTHYKTSEDGGALISEDGERLILLVLSSNKTKYTIPEGVIIIKNNTIDGKGSMSQGTPFNFTIPNSVTTIESNAFSNVMGGLGTITITMETVNAVNKLTPSPNIPTSNGTVDTFFGGYPANANISIQYNL